MKAGPRGDGCRDPITGGRRQAAGEGRRKPDPSPTAFMFSSSCGEAPKPVGRFARSGTLGAHTASGTLHHALITQVPWAGGVLTPFRL